MVSEAEIIRALDSSGRGQSISELSGRLKADRRTTAKLLEVLKAKGIVEFERVGMVKLWSVSKSPIISLLLKDDEQSVVLKNILNSLDEGISILDKDLKIIWVNDTVKKMAKRLTHLQGRRCYETYLNRKDICAKCPAMKTFSSDKMQKSVERGKDKNNNSYHYQFITAPIRGRDGKAIAIIETIRDLSDLTGKA
ncbi:MAG: PAS domain-containing protein [Candidatus Diapherotrites archaeon]|nr:PAS domain-containing protein [Candidatus Diapherotrites archaeon]